MRRAHAFLHLLREPLGFFSGDLLHDLLRVESTHGRMVRDPLGHQRLRERGLVTLVVPVPPIADEIDDGVAPEPPAEREGETDGRDGALRVIGVDVDDRCVEALREVAQYRVERPSSGSVVNPTWLFAIRCSVPPVV